MPSATAMATAAGCCQDGSGCNAALAPRAGRECGTEGAGWGGSGQSEPGNCMELPATCEIRIAVSVAL